MLNGVASSGMQTRDCSLRSTSGSQPHSDPTVSIIIVHNHPSGDPTPSPEDIMVTETIRKAAELTDIQVLDHIVIGRQRYVSLKERGLGFG